MEETRPTSNNALVIIVAGIVFLFILVFAFFFMKNLGEEADRDVNVEQQNNSEDDTDNLDTEETDENLNDEELSDELITDMDDALDELKENDFDDTDMQGL